MAYIEPDCGGRFSYEWEESDDCVCELNKKVASSDIMLHTAVYRLALTSHTNTWLYYPYTKCSATEVDPLFDGAVDGYDYAGWMTLEECVELCEESVDSHGRPCVAVEFNKYMISNGESGTSGCSLAWTCEEVNSSNEADVYKLDSSEQAVGGQGQDIEHVEDMVETK